MRTVSDKNLCRVELTELERAEHLARRKDIYIARHPETRPVSERGGPGRGKTNDNLSPVSTFAQDTASKTGMDERSIQRATRRAERIASDVKEAIKDTAIADSGVELDALAAVTRMKEIDGLREIRLQEVERLVGVCLRNLWELGEAESIALRADRAPVWRIST